MGVSNDAILVFGIDLGEEFPEVLQSYMNEREFEHFLASEELGLGAEPDFENNLADWKVWQSKKREAVKTFPVDLTTYCSYEYPMYILAVRGTEKRAHRGHVREIYPESDFVISEDDIRRFLEFCAKYGIEGKPQWFLNSMNG